MTITIVWFNIFVVVRRINKELDAIYYDKHKYVKSIICIWIFSWVPNLKPKCGNVDCLEICEKNITNFTQEPLF